MSESGFLDPGTHCVTLLCSKNPQLDTRVLPRFRLGPASVFAPPPPPPRRFPPLAAGRWPPAGRFRLGGRSANAPWGPTWWPATPPSAPVRRRSSGSAPELKRSTSEAFLGPGEGPCLFFGEGAPFLGAGRVFFFFFLEGASFLIRLKGNQQETRIFFVELKDTTLGGSVFLEGTPVFVGLPGNQNQHPFGRPLKKRHPALNFHFFGTYFKWRSFQWTKQLINCRQKVALITMCHDVPGCATQISGALHFLPACCSSIH